MKTIRFTEVREFYKRNNPDGHWFDKDTLEFFQTKLPEIAYQTEAGVHFITRETSPSGVTAYTVRRQLPDGKIRTVGEFHHYLTRAAAARAIRELSK